MRWNTLLELIPKNVSNNIWYPLYINRENNLVKTKIMGKRSSFDKPRYGIENFLYFTGEFQNWSVTQDIYMSSDWILNAAFTPYDIIYGILCWFKKNDDISGLKWNQIANGSIIKTLNSFSYNIDGKKIYIGSDIKLVKYNDKILVRLDSGNSSENNRNIIDVNNNSILIEDNRIINIKNTDISLSTHEFVDWNYSPYSFWIPDGEYFSYVSKLSRNTSYVRDEPYNSYISPTLYSQYRQIYNLITQNIPRSNFTENSLGSSKEYLRRLKRIAKILATSPMLDRTTHSYLLDEDLQNKIHSNLIEYEVIKYFSTLVKDLSSNVSKANLNNNLINNKIDLIKKILNKYGAHLVMNINGYNMSYNSGPTSILTYTGSDISKYNVSISQSMNTLYNTTGISADSQKEIYNNQEIKIGKIDIKTLINSNESKISMNGTDLPLYDIAKNAAKDISLFACDMVIGLNDPLSPQEITIPLKNEISSSEHGSFLWSQISGPCLRFNDYNRDRFRVSRYSTSTYDTPDAYIYGYGKYELKLMVSFDTNIVSDVATLYAVNLGADIKLPNGYLLHNGYDISPLDIIKVKVKASFSEDITITGSALLEKETLDIEIGTDATQPIAKAVLSIPVDRLHEKLLVTKATLTSGGLGYISNPYIIENDALDVDLNDVFSFTVREPYTYTNKPDPISNKVQYNSYNERRYSDIKYHLSTELPSDQLKVMCPNLSQYAIHQDGIFWPIKTNCYIGEYAPNRTILNVDNLAPNVYPLGPLDKFFFNVDQNITPENLKIAFTPGYTVITLDAISIEKMRDNNPDSASCKSFFEDIIVRQTINSKDPSTGQATTTNKYSRRSRTSNSIIYVNKYAANGTAINGPAFPYRNVSTKSAPSALSYGGYGSGTIPINLTDMPDHPGVKSHLPVITGRSFDEQDRLCYLKPANSYINNSSVTFTKGVFDPFVGWKKNDNSNRSSVLRFNPGERKTFRLVGAGFSNMQSKYNNDTNIPAIYKSSINLKVSSQVGTEYVTDDTPESAIAGINERNAKKEIGDIDPNLGYRNLGYTIDNNINGIPSDEFAITNNLTNTTEPYCNQNITYSYEFPVRGSRYSRQEAIDNNTMQRDNIENLIIQDLEVRLQFLNYVNTKNLIVWLEVNPCEYYSYNVARNQKDNPSYDPNNFYDNSGYFNSVSTGNPDIEKYLAKLINTNSASSSSIKLCLLNREHIDNNKYNTCIYFSDYASKYNQLSNLNMYSNYHNHQQIVDNDILHIQPTIVADAYSDSDISLYKSAIQANNILSYKNTFTKFKNLPLFKTHLGHNDSNTTFTLNIAVVDDSDEMYVYDNVVGSQVLSNFSTINSKIQSTQLYNSLCYWELIVHTAPVPKFIPNDSLGQINYESGSYTTGHDFIADFTGKEHLIPAVNLNAPNIALNHNNFCSYYADGEKQSPIINKVDLNWVSTQILSITASISIGAALGLAGGVQGAVAGGVVGAALASPFYFALNTFLSQISIRQTQETVDEHVEKGSYDQWGHGKPDKALIDISKDGLIWYTLEAPIFKYNNSLILKPNQYNYIKLTNSQAKIFSQFKYQLVYKYTDILDLKTIKSCIALSEDETEHTQINPNNNPRVNNYLLKCYDPAESLTSATNSLHQIISEISEIYSESVSNKFGTLYEYLFTKYTYKNLFSDLLEPGEAFNFVHDRTIIQRTSAGGSFTTGTAIESKILGTQKAMPDRSGIYVYTGEKFIPLTANNIPLKILANNNLLQLKSLTDHHNLLIENLRAYNFFDIDNTVVLNDEDTLDKSYTVAGKGWIKKNNKYYSIIQLKKKDTNEFSESDIVSASGKIGLLSSSANVIMIYKPGQTMVDDIPIDKWGLEKSQIKPITPDTSISVLGEGSYGYGSNVLDQNYLSNIFYENKLKPIYEILNNHENNRYKYNKLKLINGKNNNEYNVTNKLQGFAYGLEVVYGDKNNYQTDPELILPSGFNNDSLKQKILSTIQNDSTMNLNIPKFSFMDIKCDELSSAPDYGTITIEDDYIISKPPSSYITTNDIRLLTNRLSSLNAQSQGQIPSYMNINSVDSIDRLEKYYDSLKSDPLLYCYSKTTYNADKCPKNETKQRLYRLYKERNEIIAILDSMAQRDTAENAEMPYKTLYDSSTESTTSIRIIVNDDRSLSIQNNIPKNMYWIHIDPNQQCKLSKTSTIKILAETKYYCYPTLVVTSNEGLQYSTDDPEAANICGSNIKTDLVFPDGQDTEILSVKLGKGSDRGNAIVYAVPETIIKNEKAKYPAITKWEKVELAGPTGPTRSFYINTDKGNNDIYVEVTETYWMPAKSYIEKDYQEPIGFVHNKVQDIFNLNDTSSLKVRFVNIPRKLKGVDQHYDRYEPNANGGYSQGTLKYGRGGPVANDLMFWTCIDSKTGKRTKLSGFYQYMNEMIFRCFFGSADGVENKNSDISDSKEPWEWIPYEYDV